MLRRRSALAFLFLVSLSLGAAHADERRSGFIAAPGGPVWYEVMGGGEGVPLLALHGGPGGTSCGLQVLAPLGDERAVIRYDQLGSGRSGRPDDRALWNRDRFVAELDALRSALNLTEVHILGHSWGGALAAYYYLETEAAGVHSLILSSPLISTPQWIADTNSLRAQLPRRVQRVLTEHENAGTTDSQAYRAAEDRFNELFVRRGEAVESYTCPDAPWNPVIYNHMWGPTEFFATGTLQDFDLTKRLDEITVPVLLLTGEFDEARPETVEGFADLVPDARFVVIPGVAHASASRAPDLYRDLVRSFLDEVDASRAQTTE